MSFGRRGDAQTSVLEELLKLVLGAAILLFIFGFFGKFFLNFFTDKSVGPTMESFDALVEEINSIKDGEQKNVAVFTEKKEHDASVFIAFPPGDAELPLGTKCSIVNSREVITLWENNPMLQKPVPLCGDSACLCYYDAKDLSQVNLPARYMIAQENLVACVAFDIEIQGGIGTFTKPENNVPGWQDVLPEGRSQIWCNMGIVPAYGSLGVVGLKREKDIVFMCLGNDCEGKVICSELDETRCRDHVNECHPVYSGDSFTECRFCPEHDFDCADITSGWNCGRYSCKSACERNHCGGDCFFRPKGTVFTQLGDCYNAASLKDWEKLLTLESCLSGKFYPDFIGSSFSNCKECPTGFTCSQVRSTLLNPLTDSQKRTICEADICSRDCTYEDGTCRDESS